MEPETRTATGCAVCGRAVWSTDVDAEQRCCFCQSQPTERASASPTAEEAAEPEPAAAPPTPPAPAMETITLPTTLVAELETALHAPEEHTDHE